VTPTRTATKALTPEARAAYQRIDLTFHDLGHEAASKLLEAGMPLHEVSAMLGHRNISTTSRYLNAQAHSLLATVDRIDAREAELQAVANAVVGDGRPSCNDVGAVLPQVTVN
jgi:site-specific recombinase XerD